MHDKLFFSLAILSYPIDPHTFIIHDFLSYQASLAYNPKEFLGVITPNTPQPTRLTPQQLEER
jgi:hypothetical protein